MNPINFEIILGTYEEFVVGYRFNSNKKELVHSFASHSHSGSIRCVTHSGHYLASGGADDRIVIYDLKSRKEHCMLTHHNGTINCLQFTEGHTHLITGGSDGVLSIVRVGNWQLEKVWEKAHKGSQIIDIAIHSSNKLALTLGADCTLRTWNLIKGRQAYVINLNSKSKDPKSLQFIKWAPDNVRFILCGGCYTDIWSIESGGVVKPIEHENKVSYCLFYDNNTLIVGFENGCLSMLSLDTNNSKQIQGHANRIKTIDTCKGYLITCSSNGEMKVWDKNLEEVATCNTGCRLTCLCVVLPTWIKKEENQDNSVDINIVEENKSTEISTDEESSQNIIAASKKIKGKNKNLPLIEGKESRKKKKKKDSIEVAENKLSFSNIKQSIAGEMEQSITRKKRQKSKNREKSVNI